MIDYAGPYVFGVRGFVVSAEHFAERYGLIVIIALGESIVAIGIGAAGIELSPTVVIAAVLGLVLACALWWAYFDIVALVARRKLMAARGHERARLARDAYSYLHLPMFAGIVLVALGAKKVLAHVEEPLATVPAFALCAGVALYLFSHDLIRYRNVGTVNPRRCLAAALSVALIPVATQRRRGRGTRARRGSLRRAGRLRDGALQGGPCASAHGRLRRRSSTLRPRRLRRPGRP